MAVKLERKQKIAGIENSDLFTVLFSKVHDNVYIPLSPLPFFQCISIENLNLAHISKRLEDMANWAETNINHFWYIDPKSFQMTTDSTEIVFNFSTEEDLVAFKLRWV